MPILMVFSTLKMNEAGRQRKKPGADATSAR
jgi:hypothetical protein